jgi:hypothetical protein
MLASFIEKIELSASLLKSDKRSETVLFATCTNTSCSEQSMQASVDCVLTHEEPVVELEQSVFEPVGQRPSQPMSQVASAASRKSALMVEHWEGKESGEQSTHACLFAL